MAAIASCLLACVLAHRQYLDAIPNGQTFVEWGWPAIGHVAPLPHKLGDVKKKASTGAIRFARNRFGADFAAAGFKWTEMLCRRDSDDDGRTNGEELGDPHCSWSSQRSGGPPLVSNASLLSHPGIPGQAGHLATLRARSALVSAQLSQEENARAGGGRALEMQSRLSAPAAELFQYHYQLVPAVLCLGLALWRFGGTDAISPRWWVVLVETWLIAHVGVFLGCHRWASHHAFKPSASMKWLFSILAAWGVQGTPVHWAFLHRLHHRFCDQPGLDLQSPMPPHGFWYGHGLWLITPVQHWYLSSPANAEAMVPDLLQDDELPRLGRDARYHALCHVLLLTATVVGYGAPELARQWRCRRTAADRLKSTLRATVLRTYLAVCWYFFLPVALAFQLVLLVIDAVHMWGDAAFEDAMSSGCDSRNNALLLVPLLGENWHNNHHASPQSATTWVFWWQVDLQYVLIRALEQVGLVSEIVTMPPTRLQSDYSPHVPIAEWTVLALLLAVPWWGAPLGARFMVAAGASRMSRVAADLHDEEPLMNKSR